MRSIYIIFFIAILFPVLSFSQAKIERTAERSCSSMDVFELQNQDPNIAAERSRIEAYIQEYIAENKDVRTNAVITIPTVFHIVHDGDPIGVNENVSDATVMAQLAQLNEDFRLLNADAVNVPAEFANLQSDLEIEFCLAVRDPDGNPTTGILRHDLGVASWTSTTFDNTAKPATVWDRDDYLNFWSANLSGGLLGYAQFPGGPANTDGVVCLYSSMGSLAMPNPVGGNYDLGRTATHEVGHWLNLRHIWGDGGCSVDDFVADTPTSGASYGGCPAYPSTSCGTSDMFMNYMDYVFDECMYMFTPGQKQRTDAVLAGSRSSLLSSLGCTPLTGFTFTVSPDPVQVCDGADAIYDVELTALAGFTGDVTLSATGNPAGTTIAFSTNPVSLPGTTMSTMTISNTGAAAAGSYTINVSGVSGSDSFDTNVELVVSCAECFYTEDFESGGGSWTFDVTTNDGAWVVDANPFGSGFANPGSGNWAYYDDDATGNVGGNQIATATSPSIDISGHTNHSLTFAYNHQTYNTEGQSGVSVSDGTNTYYWDGSAWVATQTYFLTNDASGVFDELLPAGLSSPITVSLEYDDESDWAWGFGFDDFAVCGEPISAETNLSIGMSVVPSIVTVAGPLNIAIETTELNGAGTTGITVVRISKDPKLTFTWDATLTQVGFTPVNNSLWTYDGTDPLFHLFSIPTINANSSEAFGIECMYDTQGATGSTSITGIIALNSGGDTTNGNNIDADVIVYNQ